MKSYTDLEQSKKLAEILPITSADMVYIDAGYCSRVLPSNDIDANSYPTICPCWSLAALLTHIPNVSLHHTPSGWRADSSTERKTVFGPSQDNSIDACYEMILKLNELKML